VQKKLPGNIGEEIRSDADVKIKKKDIRITASLIWIHSQWLFGAFVPQYNLI